MATRRPAAKVRGPPWQDTPSPQTSIKRHQPGKCCEQLGIGPLKTLPPPKKSQNSRKIHPAKWYYQRPGQMTLGPMENRDGRINESRDGSARPGSHWVLEGQLAGANRTSDEFGRDHCLGPCDCAKPRTLSPWSQHLQPDPEHSGLALAAAKGQGGQLSTSLLVKLQPKSVSQRTQTNGGSPKVHYCVCGRFDTLGLPRSGLAMNKHRTGERFYALLAMSR